MAKRKPPSQRPELKMDETASAIARLRDESKAPKESDTETSLASSVSKPPQIRSESGLGHRKATQVAPPSSSTKRQKSG